MAKRNVAATFINVMGTEIRFMALEEEDYFSLTDIAKKFNEENPAILILNWMRNKDSIEFLGTWEVLNNPHFNLVEFDKAKNEAGTNRYVLSPTRWAEATGAIGIQTRSGRYGGGSFAHRDIAMAFCYWLSPSFQLYVIKEFQRLKKAESEQLNEALGWNLRRELSKINYHIHTDAVKEHLLPARIVNTKSEGIYYASEADLLNLAIFGCTAKMWREANPESPGNLRDNASAEHLLVLSNLENLNAEFIKQGLDRDERLERLNEIAIYQMQLLVSVPGLKNLR